MKKGELFGQGLLTVQSGVCAIGCGDDGRGCALRRHRLAPFSWSRPLVACARWLGQWSSEEGSV